MGAGGRVRRLQRLRERGTRGRNPAAHHALLFHATREDARRQAGTAAAAMFQYRRPRLFFSHGEQELLLHSLLHETEDEAAQSLCLAVVTVKKRWQSIYDRVSRNAPELYALMDSGANPQGRAKKRHLLNYLRYHMEELRPLLAPVTAARLAAASPKRQPRRPQLGTAAGQVRMSEDFDAPLSEFEEYR